MLWMGGSSFGMGIWIGICVCVFMASSGVCSARFCLLFWFGWYFFSVRGSFGFLWWIFMVGSWSVMVVMLVWCCSSGFFSCMIS